MQILHIIDSLSVNGRTILLQELVRSTRNNHEHLIISLRSTGTLTNRFTEMGIKVYSLNVYKPFQDFYQKIEAIKYISRFKPHCCLCWSGDANLFSTIFRLFRIPVVWTIHNSTIQWNTARTRYGIRFTAMLSKLVPEKIICCSNKTLEVYSNIHRYYAKKLLAISNGVDVTKFNPNLNERQRVRIQLQLPEDALVISTAARIELVRRHAHGDFKDLETLFKAAAIVCRRRANTFFLLFGLNLSYDNMQLVDWLEKYNIKSNVKLLGFQNNVASLFSASDIFAMSSTSGEGLPLALLEAMACGSIPVCTDSGDISLVVGSAGFVVPQKDANKLSDAILSIAELSVNQRNELSQRAISIVRNYYAIDTVARQYTDVINKVISKH